jgi:6-phosphogluconate dehydrogenase
VLHRQGGCIIRAKVLGLVEAAFTKDPSLANLLLDEAVAAELSAREAGWRRFVLVALSNGIPVPALSASLTYFDTLRAEQLHSAQCIQAQRDCFGGHSFKRLDMPGTFSTKWR